MSKLKVIVTGGAGYIGSVLTKLLLENGYEVIVYDNYLYGQASLFDLCNNKNLELVNGDVRDFAKLKKYLDKSDVVIPLAALVGAPICSYDPIGSKTINFDANINIFKNLSNSQIVLMPTTNSAYGTGDKDNYCNEESPLNPISNYAKDKVTLEKELFNLENFVSFRLATVFGMSQRMRLDLLVNDFVYRATKDKYIVLFEGHFKRNYLHVYDAANVFIHALKNFDKMKNNIYNVGLSDANLSKIELCDLIKEKIEGFVFFEEKINKDPDQRNYIVSNEKIEQSGFSTAVSLSQGIDELIKGYSVLKRKEFVNF